MLQCNVMNPREVLVSPGGGSPLISRSPPAEQETDFILPQAVQFGYHKVCGKNVTISRSVEGDYVYTGKETFLRAQSNLSGSNAFTSGNGVYSAVPLTDTAEFEVRLDRAGVGLDFAIGVAKYEAGVPIRFYRDCSTANHCMWRATSIHNYLESQVQQISNYGTSECGSLLKNGDRFGLRLSCDGKLEFFLNGKSQGVAEENVYEEGYDVYVVVDYSTLLFSTAQYIPVMTTVTRAVMARTATPLHSAAWSGDTHMVKQLLTQEALAHSCTSGVNLVGVDGLTPLHSACANGQVSMVTMLISEFKANVNCTDCMGRTPLHLACAQKCGIDLVRILHEYKADVNCTDSMGRTPLHLACAQKCGIDLVRILVHEYKADVTCTDSMGRTPLHFACVAGHGSVIKTIAKYISPLVVDDNGDTPLHTCSAFGHYESVEALLQLNAPILARNHTGKIPRDVATGDAKFLLDEYYRKNKLNIIAYYNNIQECAKKKYSTAEHITKVLVIGNPGAGKSSLVETLKREGLFDSFRKVSVDPHTAGIIPSVHTSKYYGRVLFYDFAGDPEYYSSHAAILENLASSRKGDNIFIIVVDLREENAKINGILNYWIAFIRHQKFGGEKLSLIIIGSHTDLIFSEEIRKKEEILNETCKNIQPGVLHSVAFFLLNCCKPKSKKISEVQKHIISLTKESPCYKLSPEASMLLGLLEKDFSNVTACSIQTLVSHIETTGIPLPTEVQSLHSILYELHEIGLVFVVGDSNMDNLQVVLSNSQLTNKVHQLLFSSEAKLTLKKSCGTEENIYSFNVGIIPHDVLLNILPEYITKECLVQLQYCQEIRHEDVGAFSSLAQSASTNRSFLFFPALCSVDKSDVSWVTPPNLSYSIGWLARCTDPRDYFPPRFLHVLLLRLIFSSTLSVPTQNEASKASPDHNYFQRCCTMWKSGVHWLMEEGVECMVELVSGNREVVVLAKSIKVRSETCVTIFNEIISSVMEVKAEFCHSIRPEFFLLDSTNEVDYLSADNLFAVSSVKRILTEGKEVVVSVTGKRQMESSKLLCMRKFTLWYSLFPIDSKSVLQYLGSASVVHNLHDFGLQLGFSDDVLDALEANFPCDVEKRRGELVRRWMNVSLDLDPPCWLYLMEALESIHKSTCAEKVKEDHSVDVQLQKKLLVKRNHSLTPDVEFLETFAGVVGSKWLSLAISLSLSETEIEEVKGEGISQQEPALQMLKKWVLREDATYGQLFQRLKTISLFQYGNQ